MGRSRGFPSPTWGPWTGQSRGFPSPTWGAGMGPSQAFPYPHEAHGGSCCRLGPGRWSGPGKPPRPRAGLVPNRGSWRVSEWFLPPPPPPLLQARGHPPVAHVPHEDLVQLLEFRPPSAPHTITPRPVLSQLHCCPTAALSFQGPGPRRGPALLHRGSLHSPAGLSHIRNSHVPSGLTSRRDLRTVGVPLVQPFTHYQLGVVTSLPLPGWTRTQKLVHEDFAFMVPGVCILLFLTEAGQTSGLLCRHPPTVLSVLNMTVSYRFL